MSAAPSPFREACPFCGYHVSRVVLGSTGPLDTIDAHVRCVNCLASGPRARDRYGDLAAAAAVEKWNAAPRKPASGVPNVG